MKNSMKRAKIFTLMMSILVGVSISMFVSFAEEETVDIDMLKGDVTISKTVVEGESIVITQGEDTIDASTSAIISVTGSNTENNKITVNAGVKLNKLSIKEGDSELTISTLSRNTAEVSAISSERPLKISGNGTLNIGELSGTSVEVSSSGIVNLNGSVTCSSAFNITKGSVTADAGIICSGEEGTFVMTGGTLTAKVESGAAISAATIDVKEAESGGLTQGGYIFLEGNDAESAKLSSTQSLTVANGKTAAYVHVYPGYELKYDDNTEEATTGTMETKYTSSSAGKAITVDKCGFDRPGYILKNWNTQADGSGTEYVPGEAITMGADTTLYAQWMEGYTITYTDGVEDEEIFKDVVYEVKAGSTTPEFGEEDPERTGYTLEGWDPPLAEAVTENVTYTAQWEANKYTITLNGNEGQFAAGETTDIYIKYDTNQFINSEGGDVSVPIPSQEGYTFEGYYTETEAGNVIINKEGNLVANVSGYTDENGNWINTSETVTLYAQWKAKECTIRYYYNNGTENFKEVTYNDWETNGITLWDGKEIDAGTSELKGWNEYEEAADEGFVLYEIGSEITAKEDGSIEYPEVLYAVWDPSIIETKTCTITLNGNGGTFGENETLEITATVGSSTLPNITAPMKERCSLTGYYTAAENGNKIINADGTLVTDVEGYTDNDGNWIKAEDVELYAQWSVTGETKYTVTYTDGVEDEEIFKDVVYEVEAGSTTPVFGEVDPERTGYTFKGWNPELTETVTQNVTYTAQWEANQYTITLNGNGGQFTAEETTDIYIKYDTSQFIDAEDNEVNVPIPSQEGYTFSGYYTAAENGNKIIEADGSLVAYSDNVKDYISAEGNWINTLETVTLYAQWEANKYTITLNGNGGQFTAEETTDVYIKHDTSQFIDAEDNEVNVPIPSQEGYTFAGYYTDETEGSEVIDKDGNLVKSVEGYTDSDGKWINTSETVTLYAQWEANKYTITLDGNGGTDGKATVYYDSDALEIINAPTKAGYTLTGYYTADRIKVADTQGNLVGYTNEVEEYISESGKWINISETVTLYAQWEANNYIIQFNKNAEDATGEMQAQNFIYDQKQKLNTNTFSRQGYKFSGWNTVSDGSGDKYDDVQEVSNLVESGVVELYAQWNKENEEVIVNDNPQDNQKSSEENVVVSDSTGVNANGSNITTGQSFSQIYLALELISVLLLIIYFIYFKKRFA